MDNGQYGGVDTTSVFVNYAENFVFFHCAISHHTLYWGAASSTGHNDLGQKCKLFNTVFSFFIEHITRLLPEYTSYNDDL